MRLRAGRSYREAIRSATASGRDLVMVMLAMLLGVSSIVTGRPRSSASLWSLLVRPPPALLPPFPPAAERCASAWLRSRLSSSRAGPSAAFFPNTAMPDAPPRSPVIPVVDRGGGTILGETIAPSAFCSQDMEDAPDDTSVTVLGLSGASMRRGGRDPPPRIVRQSEKTGHRWRPQADIGANSLN